MAGYTPKYGPPGTEPEYVGSRKRGRRTTRAPSPRLPPDQQLSAQTGALNPFSDSNSPKHPTPAVILATKSLKMGKQRKAWKKTYRAQLIADNPDLLAHEVADMTEQAWKQHRPALKDYVSSAVAERKGEKWRRKQGKLNPNLAEQRGLRVTQLANEVRLMNPKLTSEEATEQAKMLEHRETIVAAGQELVERAKVRRAAKTARLAKAAEAAKAEKAVNDQRKAKERQIMNYFTKVEKNPVEEASEEEDIYEPPESFEQPWERADTARPPTQLEGDVDEEEYSYEPPESFEQPQERTYSASPSHRQQQRPREKKLFAAHERENQDVEVRAAEDTVRTTENTVRATQQMSIQHKEALRAEVRKYQAGRREARKDEAFRAEARKDEARRVEACKDEARRVEAQRDEARRREKLYQTAVKRENMKRWLQQLTQDEPEAPEEMQDDEVEELQEMKEMEEPEQMQDELDAMEL